VSSAIVAILALTIVLLMMLGELWLSRINERELRRRGAIEPRDEAYRMMRWAYPGVFIVMAVEGALWGPTPANTAIAGAVLLVVSKAFKFWAIASLGSRWTYRVLVLPNAPLVTRGPYALMRHPNYVAVVGELIGMALLVGARLSGPLCLVLFGSLLRVRVRAEEQALY
jgi:methyltransferase